MTAGRLAGLDRPFSARFRASPLAAERSAGPGRWRSYELYPRGGDPRLTADALVGGGLAFLSAWVAIALMMRWLRHASYTPFVIYRIRAGLVLLLAGLRQRGWSRPSTP